MLPIPKSQLCSLREWKLIRACTEDANGCARTQMCANQKRRMYDMINEQMMVGFDVMCEGVAKKGMLCAFGG